MSKPVSSLAWTAKIDNDRTRQIQEALIRHYPGRRGGKVDPQTEAALRKMQSDNGWQRQDGGAEDSGGPNQEHLLNPRPDVGTGGGAGESDFFFSGWRFSPNNQ
jgi:hypothetical protein